MEQETGAGMFSHTFYQTNRKAFLPVCCYPEGIKLSFCTLCFCLPTKMLYLNAPFFPLKCSIMLIMWRLFY